MLETMGESVISVHPYTGLAESLSKLRDAETAFNVLSLCLKTSVKPNHALVNAVLRACVRADRADLAQVCVALLASCVEDCNDNSAVCLRSC